MGKTVRTTEQLMLDAHTMGALVRNIAAMVDFPARASSERARVLMDRIMERYHAQNPAECLRVINVELMNRTGENIN